MKFIQSIFYRLILIALAGLVLFGCNHKKIFEPENYGIDRTVTVSNSGGTVSVNGTPIELLCGIEWVEMESTSVVCYKEELAYGMALRYYFLCDATKIYMNQD